MTNDSPFAFDGAVEITLLNTLTGTSTPLKLLDVGANVSLPAGPKVSQWFCASDSDAADVPMTSAIPAGSAGAAADPRDTTGMEVGPPSVGAGASAVTAARREAPYTEVDKAVPYNQSAFAKAVRGSVLDCETACDGLPGCLGFTCKDLDTLVAPCCIASPLLAACVCVCVCGDVGPGIQEGALAFAPVPMCSRSFEPPPAVNPSRWTFFPFGWGAHPNPNRASLRSPSAPSQTASGTGSTVGSIRRRS